MNRLEAEEVGFDRERVGVREISVTGEGHCGVKRRAVPPDAAMVRREKFRVGILADARVLVGRNVCRLDRAKAEDARPAPGVRLSPDRRLAGLAIGCPDEITSPGAAAP